MMFFSSMSHKCLSSSLSYIPVVFTSHVLAQNKQKSGRYASTIGGWKQLIKVSLVRISITPVLLSHNVKTLQPSIWTFLIIYSFYRFFFFISVEQLYFNSSHCEWKICACREFSNKSEKGLSGKRSGYCRSKHLHLCTGT